MRHFTVTAGLVLFAGLAFSADQKVRENGQTSQIPEAKKSTPKAADKSTDKSAAGTRNRKSDARQSGSAPQMQPMDPTNPDPMRPKTAPVAPQSPQSPVKPPDPTNPTAVNPPVK